MPIRPVILEPLSTGDIIDRSVRIYRQNLRPLLATVTVPFLVGAFGWGLMQFGKTGVDASSTEFPVFSFALMGFGFLLWIVYLYMMVLSVAGLSRTVGDFIMLGEPITVRGAVTTVRKRLGDLTVASLFLLLAVMVIGMISFAVLFVAVMIMVALTTSLQWAGLPMAAVYIMMALVLIGAFAVIVCLVVPLCMSRVLFIPQAIMIEGCSAGAALSRAMSLGAKNWNRVLGILIFSYFASYSLAAAVLAPVALLLWLTGYLSFERETVDAVTGGIGQFSSFLVVPVWSIAYTLLYFDSRVRREGYDVDLLVRRLPAPQVAPAPVPAMAPAFGAPSLGAMPRVKFSVDGKCLRCGRYNLFNSPSCPGCGW